MSALAYSIGECDLEHLGGVATLYANSAGLVRRHVRSGVTASDAVVDDACSFAWSRLMQHGGRVSPERAVAWLITTALHEALKLVRRQSRELSLEALLEETGDICLSRTAPASDMVVERRLRIEALSVLPERQERLLWLQGLGFRYPEMAAQTQTTVRTVERQLGKARRAVQRLEGDDAPQS